MLNPVLLTKMTPIYSSTTNDDKPLIHNQIHDINVAQSHTITIKTDVITVTIGRHKVIPTKSIQKIRRKYRNPAYSRNYLAIPTDIIKTRLAVTIMTEIPITIQHYSGLTAYSKTFVSVTVYFQKTRRESKEIWRFGKRSIRSISPRPSLYTLLMIQMFRYATVVT